MRKAGGIIALVSGCLALGTTLLFLVADEVSLVFVPDGVRTISENNSLLAGLGLDPIFRVSDEALFSLLTIVLGSVLIGIGDRTARSGYPVLVLRPVLFHAWRRVPGSLLIACGSAGALHSQELVAGFLALAVVGGIVAILPDFSTAPRQIED